MLKNLISLVFLLTVFCYGSALSDTNSIVLPKVKPKELLDKLKKENLSVILPIEKPRLKKIKLLIQIFYQKTNLKVKIILKWLKKKNYLKSLNCSKRKTNRKRKKYEDNPGIKIVKSDFLLPEKNQ